MLPVLTSACPNRYLLLPGGTDRGGDRAGRAADAAANRRSAAQDLGGHVRGGGRHYSGRAALGAGGRGCDLLPPAPHGLALHLPRP
eukprot:289595-Rhodomonas_salina.1